MANSEPLNYYLPHHEWRRPHRIISQRPSTHLLPVLRRDEINQKLMMFRRHDHGNIFGMRCQLWKGIAADPSTPLKHVLAVTYGTGANLINIMIAAHLVPICRKDILFWYCLKLPAGHNCWKNNSNERLYIYFNVYLRAGGLGLVQKLIAPVILSLVLISCVSSRDHLGITYFGWRLLVSLMACCSHTTNPLSNSMLICS